MLAISEKEFASLLDEGALFDAEVAGVAHVRVSQYSPIIAAAVHAGHGFREELLAHCLLKEQERWYEEDPNTDDFIHSLPISIVGLDSRFEYDLNRGPEDCVYEEAWGKKVWKKLPATKKKRSQEKHATFYRLVDMMVDKVSKLHGGALVVDMHSYNYKRREEESPVFNLGTERLDRKRYGDIVDMWLNLMHGIQIPNVVTTVEENGPFYGRGYFLEHITKRNPECLVLATEVKKIYCDEETGNTFPFVVKALADGFKHATVKTASAFAKAHLGHKVSERSILSSKLQKELLEVDKQLYQLTKSFEVLNYVNPVNYKSEFKAFKSSKYSKEPTFRYRQLHVDPLKFKRKLYEIPVESIRDVNVQNMYRDVIQSYADKLDMLTTIGKKKKFFYNNLRYFGRPRSMDISRAEFILKCPPIMEEQPLLDSRTVAELVKKEIEHYGFEAKVERTDRITAKVMVLNYKKTVQIRKDAIFGATEAMALLHHEVGVHMVTTMNAREQKLNILRLGLPVNTRTQEGLAVLAEYLSGNLTINRLQELALRVKCVDMMVSGEGFKDVFAFLKEGHGMEEEPAFRLTTRIFRGGGFTKDHLYLRGFVEILSSYRNGEDLSPLFLGKTTQEYLPLLKELQEREILKQPNYLPTFLESPAEQNPTLDYVLEGVLSKSRSKAPSK